MDNYFKGKNVEEELERDKIPINGIPENFLWMQVKGGSKMSNLLTHASGILEDKATSVVVWSAVGVAIAKCVSCAEILKRQLAIPHQVTKLVYLNVEEFWEPKVEGLETIVVKRQIPAIHILLSLEELPGMCQLLGYQSLQGTMFCEMESESKAKHTRRRRNALKHKTYKK
ncbi:unnamed protein product [Leptidea sinapis]|uniref:DNA/RNA-binding protein Alba-like domain-containing protein n=1 Tax=Leptidea sinapis TaxID=189913 RepID=A0A5E4R0T9_9NEOP|nr:unnamed protein product [Leptidea sinapis]